MADYTITLSDLQKKSMDLVTTDIKDWITNAAHNRARQAKEQIINKNFTHCNTNSIAIATGEEAQVDQAYSLKVVETAADIASKEKE